MRKSTQDKVFDQVLKRLPALSNDDLASVAVACQQLAQWRAQGQRNALRIPESRRTPREGNAVVSTPTRAGDEAIESFTHVEERGDE